ncbi:sensor histidine kinase [Paenibacillus cymbidii]|uniref:sensor histidine kinase n=1 Tax=Paenibacillus cymbidii TaxID=1639034 RepID=UPI001080172D|nr:sensor histidine kinase [Paenibacillus cymbidii]
MSRFQRLRTPSLYVKLLLLLLLAVSLPSVLVGYLSFNRAGSQLEKVTQAFLNENMHYNKTRIDAVVDGIEALSEQVIASEAARGLLLQPPPADRLAELDFIQRMTTLTATFATDYELKIYPVDIARYPNYATLNGYAASWFEQALRMEGRGFWHVEALRSYASPQSDIAFVRPIRLYPGLRTIGVMFVTVPRLMIKNQLVIPPEYANLQLSVVNERHQLLLSSADEPQTARIDRYFAGNGAETPGLTADGSYYMLSVPLGKYDWKLVAMLPAADFIGPIEDIRVYMGIIVAAGIVIVSLLFAVIIRNFTMPIRHISELMRRMQNGVLERCLNFRKRRDEIGQLVRGYNTMITGMEELIAHTKQVEERKRKLEMQSLVSQINPHFLYNTLDSIKWKAEKASEASIVGMVSALGNLLRFSINNNEELTTVEREIEHVRNYLNIELLRHNDNFQVVYFVQPNVLHLPFLKLTIQPLAENGVKHGLNKLRDGSGKLFVAVTRDGDDLVCTVEDNGPALPEGGDVVIAPPKQEQGEGGIGLYNVDRRLRLSFGARYGLSIRPRETGGWKVTLRHPILAEGK